MRNLPAVHATKHYLICGTTGSGKTTAIELFLRSIARRFRPRRAPPEQSGPSVARPVRSRRAPPEQLILFDAKSDVVPTLAALGLRPEDEQVWILNPNDVRSAVWNVAEATSDPLLARQFATLLVPEEKRASTPYFTDAARELVYAVLMALNHVASTAWTLRDLLCTLQSTARIKAVTERYERAHTLVERILADTQHGGGVLSTIGTKVGRFEQVAALWHTAPQARSFSIADFLERPGVLILGNDPVLRESFWPINAILLKALTQEILRRPNTLQPRHWFVLDEFRAMEKVEAIHDLLNRGRSKGASVLLGIQSIDGLLEIYGEHNANDILTQCGHKTFLRAGGPKTARWAEEYFGKVRRTVPVVTEQGKGWPLHKSVQYQLQERPLFLASYFLDLPFPGPGEFYSAVSDVPSLKRILNTRWPFDQLLQWCRKPRGIERKAPGVQPREDKENLHLQPWTKDEELFFCGRPVEAGPPGSRKPGEREPAEDTQPSGGKPTQRRKT